MTTKTKKLTILIRRPFRKVNEELILMYQAVDKFLSERAKEASYGDGYIDALSEYIQNHFPGIKGFNRRGLYRMKQFYELYASGKMEYSSAFHKP